MIKKQLITCSVIIVMSFIFGLNFYGISVMKPVNKSNLTATSIFTKQPAENSFSFADEAMPVNDASISRKMRRTLVHHDFKNVQSNILQIKAERLFPIIEPILHMYGIPDDFKYLPLVESGLDGGVSSKGAAGLWQFMPGTARTYGLKVGHGVDERQNVRKSTIAACKYIKELYGEFNSWTLAAAAYNNGSIKLAKAMRENKQSGRNYFRMHLNRETGDYVYNLIAMKEIIVKPAKYGFNGLYAYVEPQSKELLSYN